MTFIGKAKPNNRAVGRYENPGGRVSTLQSGIDVGQGITIGPGKFVKMNKCRALNKRRA